MSRRKRRGENSPPLPDFPALQCSMNFVFSFISEPWKIVVFFIPSLVGLKMLSKHSKSIVIRRVVLVCVMRWNPVEKFRCAGGNHAAVWRSNGSGYELVTIVSVKANKQGVTNVARACTTPIFVPKFRNLRQLF